MNSLETRLKIQAIRFREEQALSPTEPIPLKSLLMKLKILTVFKPLGSEFSGMAQKSEGHKFMLINSGHSIGRQNFTICHEMYHLLIQQDFTAMVCKAGRFPKDDINELSADLFASHLLVPENGVLKLIPNEQLSIDTIHLTTLLFIENYYGCSRMALLRTLKKLGLITNISFEKYSINVVQGAGEYGYKNTLYKADKCTDLIGDYVECAKKLFDAELISETNYRNALLEIGLNQEVIEEDIPNEAY